jgi:hypothetical protein
MAPYFQYAFGPSGGAANPLDPAGLAPLRNAASKSASLSKAADKSNLRRGAALTLRQNTSQPIAFDFECFAPSLHQLERSYRPEQEWHHRLLNFVSATKTLWRIGCSERPRAGAGVSAREFPVALEGSTAPNGAAVNSV